MIAAIQRCRSLIQDDPVGKNHRYLRIAISALSLTACTLLLALWVRSYSALDRCRGLIGEHVVNFESGRRDLGIGNWAWRYSSFPWTIRSESYDESVTTVWPFAKGEPPLSNLGIRWYWHPRPQTTLVVVPFWLLVLTTAITAAAPWLKYSRRFSLRAMLIAWMLFAVVLGLIDWNRPKVPSKLPKFKPAPAVDKIDSKQPLPKFNRFAEGWPRDLVM